MPTTTEEIAHPPRAEIELGEVLHALSDPVRLRIVAELARAMPTPHPTCGSFDVPVSKSTCTHHFKVLREAGLIHQQPRGPPASTRFAAMTSRPVFPACSRRSCRRPRRRQAAPDHFGVASVPNPT